MDGQGRSMPIVPSDVFEAAFADLSIERRVSLLAAIWETRGLSVDRDGSRLRLDRDESVRVVSFDPGPDEIDDAVDVVVVPNPSSTRSSTAETNDVDVVTAEDVRNLLLYGIDRDDAERIYRTHFDRSIYYDREELTPDPGLRARLSTGPGSGTSLPISRAGLAIVLVVVALGLVVWAPVDGGTDGADPVFGSGDEIEFDAQFEGVDDDLAGEDATATEDGDANDRPHPAIRRDGSLDLDTLVDRHTRLLRTASFTMNVDHSGPADGTSYELSPAAEMSVRVESPETFRFDRRSYDPRTDQSNDSQFELYADGERRYVRTVDGDQEAFDSLPIEGGETEQYVQYSATNVDRFLGTGNVTIEASGDPAGEPFRVIATGQPDRLFANVSNYTAEATVTPSGYVESIAAEYLDESANETVRFELVISDVGETTVDPPDWYADHPDRSNETNSDEMHSNDTGSNATEGNDTGTNDGASIDDAELDASDENKSRTMDGSRVA